MTDISVVIPTYRRPDGVARAVRSVFAQRTVGRTFEIVVVDNCPSSSSQAVIAALRAESPVPFTAVAEPKPGVANARNTGWAAASGGMIASLDDDEEAEPDWLGELARTRAAFDCPVVFGPVKARVPDEASPHAEYFRRFFSRFGPASTGVVDDYYGMGNSLIDRAALKLDPQPFSLEANDRGGEDDRLFAPLRRARVPMAWAADATVWEIVPANRATLRYTLKRTFAYGQGPSQACAHLDPPQILGVAGWMAVGALQVGAYGAAAAGAWLIRSQHRATLLDKAVQGAGKVLWFPPFEPRLYGSATTSTPLAMASAGASEAASASAACAQPATGRIET